MSNLTEYQRWVNDNGDNTHRLNYLLSSDDTFEAQADSTKVKPSSVITDLPMGKIKDINDVIKELEFPEIQLFKVNIEGSEYDLLDRCIQINLLPRIKHLQVQFHSWYDEAKSRRANIVKELSKTHICKYNYLFVWEGWSLR